MNGAYKLDCSITQLEGLISDEHSNLLGQLLSFEKIKSCEYAPREHFMNGPNKLECLSLAYLTSSVLCNTTLLDPFKGCE